MSHPARSLGLRFAIGAVYKPKYIYRPAKLASLAYIYTLYKRYLQTGASIPPEAMVHSPQDGRMGPPNFWL